MRIERVGLEHHGDAALGRRQVVTSCAADQRSPAGDVLEARDQAQQRRLSAAGGADEDDELAVVDVEIDALDDLHVRRMTCDVLEDDFAMLPTPSRRRR